MDATRDELVIEHGTGPFTFFEPHGDDYIAAIGDADGGWVGITRRDAELIVAWLSERLSA